VIRWFLIVILAAAAGAVVFLQREAAASLRRELALLRDDARDLASLKAEHERLRAAQVPQAELDRLNADRAALLQLRSEIEGMKRRADEMARAGRLPPKAAPSTR
jgi:hypothetical protein